MGLSHAWCSQSCEHAKGKSMLCVYVCTISSLKKKKKKKKKTGRKCINYFA